MKRGLVITTRWEYYAANIAGAIALASILSLCVYYSIDNGKIDFRSFLFWIAVLSLCLVPSALITFFSSIKSVLILDKELIISYVFQKHQHRFLLSEITGFRSKVSKKETDARPASFTDTFSITLADGRTFSFSYSQFNNYYKLKSTAFNAFARNKR